MALVNYTPITNGDGSDVSQINDPIESIIQQVNGNIDTVNLASGAVVTAKLGDSAVTTAKIADDAVTPAKWTNPYCFRATKTSDQTLGDVTWTPVTFEAEEFDLNNNFDLATNAYTAPVDGIYHFDAFLYLFNGSSTIFDALVGLEVNDSGVGDYWLGRTLLPSTAPYNSQGVSGGADIKLTAGDTVGLIAYANLTSGTVIIQDGWGITFFSGHLVHAT